MKLKVIYDNEACKGLKSGWGFSCLIEDERKVLFDTGWDGSILLYNMKALGIDPKDIEIIVLSHDHWDHIGGLTWVLNLNPGTEVYAPSSFSKRLKEEISSKAKLIEVDGPVKICERIYTTGVLGTTTKEQSLLLETKEGLIVITGCAHPGISAILDRASSIGHVYGIMGGFHGFEDYDLLKDKGFINPCHCTMHKSEISRLFPDTCETNGAGWSMEF
ncbi:MAG: MBL fold metallo-hydrolase [Methanocellales archaeon]|nr:MBL fold metallo-hydrolase [Methanocellales archaeon]MDD3291242.1 MBL fold metallo-hydrolase [Methanocellales archaeon]MDD5235414.1 MBL fold metallo-hydrolase [Methanocellales archaeon]MDD5484503.1 MBL fold metallo-hydrolase [Methanocellales archaeon]